MPPGTTAKVENIPCVACFQVISELLDSWKRRGQLLPSSLLPCKFPRVRARAHTSTSLPDLEDPFDFFSNPFEELVHEGRPFYSESSPSLSVHSTSHLFETEFILDIRVCFPMLEDVVQDCRQFDDIQVGALLCPDFDCGPCHTFNVASSMSPVAVRIE